MRNWSLAHVPDHALLRELSAVASRERVALADVLAHVAEVDARKLYLPAAYPSMYLYCIGELRMSEDAACRRIQAARAAREFPAIFEMVAHGRLTLTALTLLAPRLTAATAHELLAAASGKSRAEIERLLAERFPQSETLGLVHGAADPGPQTAGLDDANTALTDGLTPCASPQLVEKSSALARMNVAAADLAAAASAPPSERGRVLPIAAGRYELRATIDQTTYDKLLKLQALLSHAVPSGDLAEVLGRAFGAAIREFEKRRFGKRGTTADDSNVRPARRRMSKSARQIPAGVRRAVHERDSGRCTFVSATGRRCEETRFLQFDHVHPVARGGTSTVDNLRLRCRAHNQYEAQRMFGAGFMAEKRASAGTPRSARTAVSAASAGTGAGAASAGSARDAAQTHERATPRPANAPLPPEQEELVPWLRALGFTVKEARSGATACASNPSASLEDRMKLALRSLAPRSARRVLPVASAGA